MGKLKTCLKFLLLVLFLLIRINAFANEEEDCDPDNLDPDDPESCDYIDPDLDPAPLDTKVYILIGISGLLAIRYINKAEIDKYTTDKWLLHGKK